MARSRQLWKIFHPQPRLSRSFWVRIREQSNCYACVLPHLWHITRRHARKLMDIQQTKPSRVIAMRSGGEYQIRQPSSPGKLCIQGTRSLVGLFLKAPGQRILYCRDGYCVSTSMAMVIYKGGRTWIGSE